MQIRTIITQLKESSTPELTTTIKNLRSSERNEIAAELCKDPNSETVKTFISSGGQIVSVISQCSSVALEKFAREGLNFNKSLSTLGVTERSILIEMLSAPTLKIIAGDWLKHTFTELEHIEILKIIGRAPLDKLKLLAENGINVNFQQLSISSYASSLHTMDLIRDGDIQKIEFFIKHGFNLNALSSDQKAAAVKIIDQSKLEWLIKNGLTLNDLRPFERFELTLNIAQPKLALLFKSGLTLDGVDPADKASIAVYKVYSELEWLVNEVGLTLEGLESSDKAKIIVKKDLHTLELLMAKGGLSLDELKSSDKAKIIIAKDRHTLAMLMDKGGFTLEGLESSDKANIVIHKSHSVPTRSTIHFIQNFFVEGLNILENFLDWNDKSEDASELHRSELEWLLSRGLSLGGLKSKYKTQIVLAKDFHTLELLLNKGGLILNGLEIADQVQIIATKDNHALELLFSKGGLTFDGLDAANKATILIHKNYSELEWLLNRTEFTLDGLKSSNKARIIAAKDHRTLELLLEKGGLTFDGLESADKRNIIIHKTHDELEWLLSKGMPILDELESADIAQVIVHLINQNDLHHLKHLCSINASCKKLNSNELQAIIPPMLKSKNGIIKEYVKSLIAHAKDNIILVGFNNINGEWSSNVIKSLKDIKLSKAIVGIPLDYQLTNSNEYLSYFDAFVNPGAGDSFPRDGKEFNIHYLDGTHSPAEHELAYQNVVKYVKENHRPYMGVCNGNQHLILSQGGYLQAVRTIPTTTMIELESIPAVALGPGNTMITLQPGSVTYFFALSQKEQSLGVRAGFYPDKIIFPISIAHGFAGVNGKLGDDIELGGLSMAGIVEAVAFNFYQLGFQFHPENRYMLDDRNANLLKNVFRVFAASKDHDMVCMDKHLSDAFRNTFVHAQCPVEGYISDDNDTNRDILGEALDACKIASAS